MSFFAIKYNSANKTSFFHINQCVGELQLSVWARPWNMQGYKEKIHVDPGAQPKYCKAQSVPYAMRGKVEEELEHLVSEGIIEPVQLLIGQL